MGRFAKELVQRLGDERSVEYLYRRGASVDQVHEYIGQYEEQTRKVPRMFVLHLGLKDVFKGETDRNTNPSTRASYGKHTIVGCAHTLVA